MIHLAPGTLATDTNGKVMCNGITGFNGRTGFNLFTGGQRHFAVIPDPSTCPTSTIDDVSMSMTHELIERVTDPVSPGDGWEDRTQPAACGIQLGDLCSGERQTISTRVLNPVTRSFNLVVQKMWSNRRGACVTEKSFEAPFR